MEAIFELGRFGRLVGDNSNKGQKTKASVPNYLISIALLLSALASCSLTKNNQKDDQLFEKGFEEYLIAIKGQRHGYPINEHTVYVVHVFPPGERSEKVCLYFDYILNQSELNYTEAKYYAALDTNLIIFQANNTEYLPHSAKPLNEENRTIILNKLLPKSEGEIGYEGIQLSYCKEGTEITKKITR